MGNKINITTVILASSEERWKLPFIKKLRIIVQISVISRISLLEEG
jgi:hypothetical protein